SYDLPPFSAIRAEHVQPAIEQILADNRVAIEGILQSQGKNPTWAGLVLAMDELNDRLGAAWSPVSHLNAVCNSRPCVFTRVNPGHGRLSRCQGGPL
ncbi:hypothetical protein, partial [Mycobacterium avium]|uniref:hypothetical protein n=1 Tax=Mycobacterium avium TaxID=1764 RepID=UPI00191C736C